MNRSVAEHAIQKMARYSSSNKNIRMVSSLGKNSTNVQNSLRTSLHKGYPKGASAGLANLYGTEQRSRVLYVYQRAANYAVFCAVLCCTVLCLYTFEPS